MSVPCGGMKTIYTSTLLLLLAGVGFYGFAYYWQSGEETVGSKTEIQSVPDEWARVTPVNDSWSESAIDPEELKRLEIENSTNTMNAAIIASDPTQCESITIAEIKKECIEKSSLALAQKENDPSKCEVLSDSGAIECKDQIYFRLAQLSGNPEDCLKISNTWIRDKCTQWLELALLKEKLKNPSDNKNTKINCDVFTNELAKEQCNADLQVAKDQSQLATAIDTQSTESCESISAPNLKQDCKDTVYFSRAKSNRNADACENIINEDVKGHCKTTVADYSDSDIFTEAIEKQSVNLCNSILAADMKSSCIDRIRISEIIKTGSKADCATLNDVSLRKSCESSF